MSWATTAARLTAEVMPRLGNAVTINGTTDWGILQSPHEAVLDGAVVVTDWMLELPAAVWPAVPEGMGITVDGVSFLAREESRPGIDGSTIHVPLERISGDIEFILNGDWL